MRNSPLLCVILPFLLLGCESAEEESEDLSSLSPSTAAFTNQEVVAAESNTTVEIEVTRDGLGEISDIDVQFTGTATPQDYRILRGIPVRFSDRSLTTTIELTLTEDNIREGGESLILTLQDPTTGSVNRNADTYFVGIAGDGQFLNDTGVTSIIIDAPAAGQDSAFGLDVTGNDTDGNDGMVFSAIDQSGNPVAPPNLCVRDEITGNTWSSPTIVTDIPWPAAGLFNNTNTYTWFNTDDNTNGGSEGARSTLPIMSAFPLGETCAFSLTSEQRPHTLSCDTQSVIDEFNYLGVCGAKDWRLPTLVELLSIVDFDPVDTTIIQRSLFADTSIALSESEFATGNVQQDSQEAFQEIISERTLVQETVSSPPLDPTFWPFITYGRYVSSTPAANNSASVLCLVYNEEATLVQLCNKQTADMKVLLTRTEIQDQTEN